MWDALRSYEKPYVVLVSLDEFPTDYLYRFRLPSLQREQSLAVLSQRGARPDCRVDSFADSSLHMEHGYRVTLVLVNQ